MPILCWPYATPFVTAEAPSTTLRSWRSVQWRTEYYWLTSSMLQSIVGRSLGQLASCTLGRFPPYRIAIYKDGSRRKANPEAMEAVENRNVIRAFPESFEILSLELQLEMLIVNAKSTAK